MPLVDDSMTKRLVAQHYLQGMGLLVETADSGPRSGRTGFEPVL